MVIALVALVSLVLPPRTARADSSTAHSVSVAVLAIDSDDAEDQADALTGAIRSRVRASQGWSLIETTQSLGMLTAALRCQAKPLSSDCASKIGDQIKSERYIYGYVTKGPQGAQVTAELHLFQRGKPDTVVKETYSDNLRDQNDDTLRKIAQRALDKLGGNAVGVVVVRFGSESGEVVVDGDKHVPMQNGTARIELSPGSHSFEVVGGAEAQKRTVLVSAGKEQTVELTAAHTSDPAKQDKPFPTRKVLGVAAMVVGAGLGVFAVERLVKYNSLQDDLKNDPAYGPDKFQKTNGSVDACDAKLADGTPSENACQKSKDAKTVSGVGIGAAALGGVLLLGGAYLFFFGGNDSSEGSKAGKAEPKKPQIVPTVGVGNAGLLVSGSF